MSALKEALEKARTERKPYIALRPHHDDPELMNDIVIRDIKTMHMEQMNDKAWWYACDFTNGDSIHFNIWYHKGEIKVAVQEHPEHGWIDYDTGEFNEGWRKGNGENV